MTTCAGAYSQENPCNYATGLPPHTPILPYGSATVVPPFRCESSTNGITCTVTSGKGFRISRSGIEPVGG
jgi:hypothetical protein